MLETRECFLLNRESDWKNSGIFQKFEFNDDRMVMDFADGKNACFVSTSFDSGESDTIWNRMIVKANVPKDASIRLSFYASNSKQVSVNMTAKSKQLVDIDKYLTDSSIPISERVHFLKKLRKTVYFDNCDDVLLYALKGRYLWMSLEIESYTYDEVSIESARIEFPRDSYVKYLPELYSSGLDDNSFLARFLGVFQSIDKDLEKTVDNMPSLFDPMRVNPEFLRWIAKWMSIDDTQSWTEEKTRLILSNIAKLYKIKGTKQSIREIVELFTGVTPAIVEQFELRNTEFYDRNTEFVWNLFGEDGYVFSVIINSKKEISTDDYIALAKLINLFKPLDSKCNLVVLTNSTYLDYHCYLGVNSYVSFNKRLVVSDSSVVTDSLFLAE